MRRAWVFLLALMIVGVLFFGMVGTALASRTVPVPAAAGAGADAANANQGAVVLIVGASPP